MRQRFARTLLLVGSIAIASVPLAPAASGAGAIDEPPTADSVISAPDATTESTLGALSLDELRNGRPGDVVLATSSTITGSIVQLPGGASFDVSDVVEPWRAVIDENGEAGFYFGPGIVADGEGVVPPGLPEPVSSIELPVVVPGDTTLGDRGGCYLGVGDVQRPDTWTLQAGQRTQCTGATIIDNTAQFRRSSWSGFRNYSGFGVHGSGRPVTSWATQWKAPCRAGNGTYDYQLNARAYTSHYGASAFYQSGYANRYNCGPSM